MDNKTILRRSYQRKFDALKGIFIKVPPQGWLKTIREIFGMTTTQFALKLGISQPRVINIEKNEKNVKISTMEKIADSLNCEFVYMFIPREKVDNILYNQAKKKAIKILQKVNKNMELENQLTNTDELIEDIIKDLLAGNLSRIWDEN